MEKIIRVWILITFTIAIQSCREYSNISEKVIKLYDDKQVVVDSLDVDTIFVNKNRLQKIKNLLLMHSLYQERDSVLHLNRVADNKEEYAFGDSLKVGIIQNASAIVNSKLEQRQVILDIRKEVDQHRVKDVRKMEVYVVWYVKNNESRYSLILDNNYDIIFAQDKQLLVK